MANPPFDITKPENFGKPLFFDLDTHIKAIIQMIQSDELQIAMTMLDQVPAWYRANYPKELAEIKRKLFEQSYDQPEYGTDQDEFAMACRPDIAASQWLGEYCYPRGEIITAEIIKLNQAGVVPWIYDLACSHGNLPHGLLKLGLEFNYLGRAMNFRAEQRIRETIGETVWKDRPKFGQVAIFVCTEAIEHMHDPMDAVRSAYKVGIVFHQIFLSVPLGCLYGGLENWDNRRLGHVRGWTAKEFSDFAQANFPGYQWTHAISHSQVLHGVRP